LTNNALSILFNLRYNISSNTNPIASSTNIVHILAAIRLNRHLLKSGCGGPTRAIGCPRGATDLLPSRG